eukprot:XP_011680305.1 PREDICTED: uncharacterized protein LOC100888648 [Strongylocentrotus purpuratus]
MDLLVFFIFAGCVTMSSAVTCYTCQELFVPFDPEEGFFDLTNCSAPSRNNDFVDTDTNCTGTCLTTISLRSSSSYYRVSRSCLEGAPSSLTSQCDIGCTNPSDCRQCCDSDFCNDASVDDIIKENRIGQTCYECRHSEIPSTGDYNPSCGLAFDPEGTALRYSFCEGLCYSAVTFIEGVEDVQRGCRGSGSSCDYANHPYLEDKSVSFGGLDYDMKCCLGSLCNGGRSLGSAMSMIVLASFLAQFLALAL